MTTDIFIEQILGKDTVMGLLELQLVTGGTKNERPKKTGRKPAYPQCCLLVTQALSSFLSIWFPRSVEWASVADGII